MSLPRRTQFSPVFGIWTGSLATDGSNPIIMTVGNLMQVKPMAGSYDASYGTISLFRDGAEPQLQSLSPSQSGFSVEGSGREIVEVVNSSGEKILIITRNNAAPKFFRVQNP